MKAFKWISSFAVIKLKSLRESFPTLNLFGMAIGAIFKFLIAELVLVVLSVALDTLGGSVEKGAGFRLCLRFGISPGSCMALFASDVFVFSEQRIARVFVVESP